MNATIERIRRQAAEPDARIVAERRALIRRLNRDPRWAAIYRKLLARPERSSQ